MSATRITAAFERWHKLWATTYPTDAESNAAAGWRSPIEREIIGTPASGLPDVLAKVRMLREQEKGGKWAAEDEMLASIITDLERAAHASPALVRLVQRERALFARYEASEIDSQGDPLFGQWRAALDAVAAFAAVSMEDVVLKLRIATAWEPLQEPAAAGDNTAMALIAALADFDRFMATEPALAG
jgi:hypothetical protein